MSAPARPLPFDGSYRRTLRKGIRAIYEERFGPRQKGVGFVRMVSALAGVRFAHRWAAWRWIVTLLETETSKISFYDTEDWRRVRYAALRRANGACQLCGRSKREHGVILHVDHIKPRSRFPALELEPSNLQVLCEDCNLGKSNTDTRDWR